MSINTSNSLKYRGMESQNSLESNRREGVGSTSYQNYSHQGNMAVSAGGPQKDGVDYNIVWRTMNEPDRLINFNDLVDRKAVLQEILYDFRDQDGRVVFEPHKRQDYIKRLQLLEQEIDGIMRQSLMYTGKGTDGKLRNLDYMTLITEKQNQVIQLEKKICYLEAELRMKDQRIQDLETELERRFALIKTKNDQIERLKGASRSYADAGKSQPEVTNNLIRNLIQKLQDLSRRGTSITQLQAEIESWILGLPNDSQLKRRLRDADEKWLENKYKKYIGYLTTEAGAMINNMNKLYTSQIDTLRSKGTAVDYDSRIVELAGREVIPKSLMPTEELLNSNQVVNSRVNTTANMGSLTSIIDASMQGGFMGGYYDRHVKRTTVEVPVQDVRTKALIYKLTMQMKNLMKKYPKLVSQMSPEITQYCTQELIDVIQVDQLDRLVQIVKYKPDVVRVQNVYNYNSQTNRRVEFHLRVLIKALLDEMERIKLRYNIQPEIDEGALGMIQQETSGIVNVDDILKVYRAVPKMVEVEKVVEKVVEKIVQVPHFVTIENTKNEIVQAKKVEVVKDTVNVPLQVPKFETLIQEKLVLKPQYHEKIVVATGIEQNKFETVTEVPTVRQIDKHIHLPQQELVVKEIPGPTEIVEVVKEYAKEIIIEKAVPIEKIVKQIVEVEKIVEKIVVVPQTIEKILEVEKIVEKLVEKIVYVKAQKLEHLVTEVPVEVIVYVDKIVPVQRIVERVVTVPQIIQKPIEIVRTEVKVQTVEVIKQVPIIETKIQIVEKIKEVRVPQAKEEVIKVAKQYIEVPFIHEKISVQKEYRKQPVVQKETQIIRQPVHVEVPVVLMEERIVQVQKPQVRVVTQEFPKQMIKEKIVPFETVRQQLIPTPYVVEKIIEKIVEVPRIVEVEKIVQKIVPIPRVVERVVEVEKIIEKIVEKLIYQTNIIEVQRLEQVPYMVERVQKIQVPHYVVQKVEVPQFIDRDKVITNEIHTESVRVQNIEQEPRIVIERKQIPIEIITQKVVPFKVEDHIQVKLVEQIVKPVQVPVPYTIVKQKFVPVTHINPLVQYVDRQREKIVQVMVETPGRAIEVERVVEKIFPQTKYEVRTNQIPYFEKQFIQVPVERQIVVQTKNVIQKIKQVEVLVDKIIRVPMQITNVVEVPTRVEIPIQTTKVVTVDRIVPQIVQLNKAFAQIVDKLHEFPRLAQEMRSVENQIQSIVPEQHSAQNAVPVDVIVQKAVIEEKLVEVQKFITKVNQSLKVVDREVYKQSDPIIITEQRVLEVPVIVQKLAERIIVMPQIMEVLKYVYQMTDTNNLGVALSGDLAIQEADLQKVARNVNGELGRLRSVLYELRNNPQFRDQIAIIDSFLAAFNTYLASNRIREVVKEKVVQSVVEKDRIVKVPTQTMEDERRSLASAVLIDKMLMQIKKLRQMLPASTQYNFDPDILLIFGANLDSISGKVGDKGGDEKSKQKYNLMLDQYAKSIFARFNMYGTWTQDHQRMLREFIDERFELARGLKEYHKKAEKYNKLYTGLVESYNREKNYNDQVRGTINDIERLVKDILVYVIDSNQKRAIQDRLETLRQYIFGYALGSDTITHQLPEMTEVDKERVSRYIREKDALIAELRVTIERLKRDIEAKQFREQGQLVYGNCNLHSQKISEMEAQLNELRKYREVYGNVGASTGTTKTITTEQRMLTTTSGQGGDSSALQAQINRIKAELTRSREEVTRLQTEIRRLQEIQIQHRGCANRIRELEERLKSATMESQRNMRELHELRAIKQTKRTTIGSVTTPHKETQVMSDSYGTNYGKYVDGSSGIRNSKAEMYEKGVFRSGGNYGPIGSGEMASFGSGANSVSGGIGGGGMSSSGIGGAVGGGGSGGFSGGISGGAGGASIGTSGGSMSGGNVISSGAYGSTGYVQQKSSQYLSESRGSGVSGVSGLSRGQLSSKSSKTGGAVQGVSYNYQEMYQKEQSQKGSGVIETNELSHQRFIKMDGGSEISSGSRLYGTSTKQIIQKSTTRQIKE